MIITELKGNFGVKLIKDEFENGDLYIGEDGGLFARIGDGFDFPTIKKEEKEEKKAEIVDDTKEAEPKKAKAKKEEPKEEKKADKKKKGKKSKGEYKAPKNLEEDFDEVLDLEEDFDEEADYILHIEDKGYLPVMVMPTDDATGEATVKGGSLDGKVLNFGIDDDGVTLYVAAKEEEEAENNGEVVKNAKKLKIGDKVKVKLAGEDLSEDDDPDTIYDSEVVEIVSSKIVTVESDGMIFDINFKEGSEIYK